MLRLGSLFSGSGGFELAGCIHGVVPVWSSEIEPFPLRVEKLRFPNCKQLGSVTDINGAEIEPVDIITFGSPCQDLSVAGKQAGIHDGERSSLFFEAVRIIREMREHDRAIERTDVDIRPRFAVWENVPGAFSSNKGADFQAVLQALCEIEGGCGVSVPMPPKGKWLPAGCVVGNGYSVAWRIYDAQYWGVPQRRKRIYLIADFASERAGEILFECEGVSGDHQQGEPAGEGTAEDAEGSVGRSDLFEPRSLLEENWASQDVKNALRAEASKSSHCVVQSTPKCLNPWDVQSKHIMTPEAQSEALCSGEKRWGALPPNVCYPAAFMGGQGAKARSIAYCDDGSTPTLKSVPSGGNTVPDVVYPNNVMSFQGKAGSAASLCVGDNVSASLRTCIEADVCYSIEGNTVDRDTKKNGCGYCQDVSPTLNTQDKHAVTYAIEGNGQRESHKGDGYKETDAMYTLNTTEQHAVAYGIDQQGGKGNASYQIDKSPTLCADSHGTPHAVAFMEAYQHHGWRKSDTAGTLTVGQNNTVRGDTPIAIEDTAEAKHLNVYPIENHPADSRCDLMKGDKCQTLTSRMGTGGNNVPMLLVLNDQGGR